MDIDRFVIDRIAEGRFTVHRDVFRDPEIFELEMRHIFEGTWVYVGLASQARAPHDFFRTWVGRTPIVVMRDGTGNLNAFLNTCRHRGAIVTHAERGNAKYHVCAYHGWAYDSAGRNVDIKDEKTGCYADAFRAENHDLVPVPRFAEYRGILFASLNANVPPLEAHLGDTRFFLDLVLDQGPNGIEAVPGSSTYVFKANWKLQIENCLDPYHLESAHSSFIKIVDRRRSGESKNKLDALDFAQYEHRGGYTFDSGHAVIWARNPMPHIRPLYRSIDEVKKRVGEERAKWMLYTRNLTIYPNVQFADNASLQLRIIRPISVDRTEMTIHCIGPIDESDAAREFRIRQYEDFFNSSGLATPDDTTCYEDCQTGYGARLVDWQQGYARGMTAVRQGADDIARDFGLNPATSTRGNHDIQDETIFHGSYREWLRLMRAGIAR